MTNRALLMMGALALGAPAWAAPPGQGALPYPVSAYTDLRLATTQSQVADFNAPLQGSLSNRFGSLSARTDYGSVRASGSFRMVNLGSGAQPHDTAGSGFWDDYFQLRQDASLGFLIDVAVGTTAPRLSGYPTQSAKVTASANVFFGSYDTSGFAAYGVARTAAADRFGATSGVSLTAQANGAFNPVTADALGLYPGAPAGFTRYLLLGDFRADTLYNISGSAACILEQTSYFLGDRVTGGCTARMLWAGLLYAAPLGGGGGSVDVSLVSPYTGVDWARPYMKSQRPDLLPPTTRPPFGRTTAMNDPAGLAAAVPEPATWAMMIAGFGMVGGMARRRTQRAAALA